MTRRRAAALAVVLLLGAAAPAAAQTLGPVDVVAGAGATWQRAGDFSPVGPNVWLGAETVLERRLRVRLAASVHYFGYRGPTRVACAPSSFCAPPITSALQLVVVTGLIVWRDTTGARRWYPVAGLGAYSDANGRDANSRIGLVVGGGWSFGPHRDWSVEARLNLPYDAYGYGTFVPVTIGRRFARFTP